MTKYGYGSERLNRLWNQLDAGNLVMGGTRVDWIVSKRGNNISCLFLQSIHLGTGAVTRRGFTRKDSRGLEPVARLKEVSDLYDPLVNVKHISDTVYGTV